MPEARARTGGTVTVENNLVTKLATIMGELGNVEKKGFNKAQNYRFVRESDVVAALVPLLAKNHIILHTTITSHDMRPLYQTANGAQMWLTTITVDGTWMDGETGETLPASTFIGYGADTGDKGIYKAMTGCEKYMLMKGFLISTGDDPEADEKVDKTAAASTAAAGPRIARGSQPGVQRGGKSSLATKAQISEVARLVRDLELDVDGFVVIASRVTETRPLEEQTASQWLATMTSDQVADIITALSATTAAPVDDDVESVDEAPPEAESSPMPIV